MKRLIILGAAILPLILLPQFAAARGSKAVDIEQTERRIDGLTYEVDSDTPLSGQVRDVYSRKKKKSEVNFVDGKRDGLSTRWHENGNKQSEETYAAGELNGVVTRWWSNGEKQFSGGFENGRPAGPRTDWYPNGNKKIESTIENGILIGLKTTWFGNGNKQQEAMMDDGQFHGLVTIWYENGHKRTEDNWVHGQKELEGPTKKWNRQGQLILNGSYRSGKLTGEMTSWFDNGMPFIEEKLVDGSQVEYAEILGQEYANGQQRGEQRWINGKRQETFWYENGQRERFSTIGDGAEDGQWTEWYENGQKKSEYKKVFGILEGPVTYWYENGQKKSQGYGVHGKKHGVHTEWFEDGRKKSESNYVAGRLADAAGEVRNPIPPKNLVVAESNTDVTYNMHTGSIRFWNVEIKSVSDGTFSGNTAVVAPGASIQMTGNWQIGPPNDPMECRGCNVQVYIAWVPDAMTRGAWPPSQGLWKGMAQSVKSDSEPGGTFDWTTQAPTLPGVYYVGRGQTLDYAFKRLTEGKLGAPTAEPDAGATASFMIEVRAKTTN